MPIGEKPPTSYIIAAPVLETGASVDDLAYMRALLFAARDGDTETLEAQLEELVALRQS